MKKLLEKRRTSPGDALKPTRTERSNAPAWRFYRITLFLTMICFYGLMFAAQAFAADLLIFSKGPLKVVAKFEEPDPDPDRECGLFRITLSVSDGHKTTTVESVPLLCKEKPVNMVRKQVSWRPPYLAVWNSCGMSNGWNCETQVVFSYRMGTLTRLGNVNDLLVLANQVFFVKNYTMLEYNDLVAHTGRAVQIVLRDAGQSFAFDADKTWDLNRKLYRKFEAHELKCDPKQPECHDDFKQAVVFNGTVAKLTGRHSHLQSLLTTAQNRLSEEEFRQFTEMMAKVDGDGVIQYITSEQK